MAAAVPWGTFNLADFCHASLPGRCHQPSAIGEYHPGLLASGLFPTGLFIISKALPRGVPNDLDQTRRDFRAGERSGQRFHLLDRDQGKRLAFVVRFF